MKPPATVIMSNPASMMRIQFLVKESTLPLYAMEDKYLPAGNYSIHRIPSLPQIKGNRYIYAVPLEVVVNSIAHLNGDNEILTFIRR